MRCLKAQKYISEYVDGALGIRKTGELERHIDQCTACRAVFEDFRAMKAAASELDNPGPADAVWLNIRNRLASGSAVPEPAADRAARRWAFGWGVPALRFAGVAALALVLVASGVYIGVRLGTGGAARYPKNSEKYTLAKLDEAEAYYQKAIKSLSEAFSGQKGTMIPQVADMFEKNLAVVNATIQACRQAVLKEPDDLQARNYLLAAYMDKVTLLDTAVGFSRGSAGALARGKSL